MNKTTSAIAALAAAALGATWAIGQKPGSDASPTTTEGQFSKQMQAAFAPFQTQAGQSSLKTEDQKKLQSAADKAGWNEKSMAAEFKEWDQKLRAAKSDADRDKTAAMFRARMEPLVGKIVKDSGVDVAAAQKDVLAKRKALPGEVARAGKFFNYSVEAHRPPATLTLAPNSETRSYLRPFQPARVNSAGDSSVDSRNGQLMVNCSHAVVDIFLTWNTAGNWLEQDFTVPNWARKVTVRPIFSRMHVWRTLAVGYGFGEATALALFRVYQGDRLPVLYDYCASLTQFLSHDVSDGWTYVDGALDFDFSGHKLEFERVAGGPTVYRLTAGVGAMTRAAVASYASIRIEATLERVEVTCER